MAKKIRLKIAVIGPPKSGKSSFITNMLNKPFEPTYQKTEEYELSVYKFTNGKTEYEIQLWECGADHKQYNKHIRYGFFKNCSAAFLTFDLTDPKWKEGIEEWISEAYEFDCFLIYAIGTKKDIMFLNQYTNLHGEKSIPSKALTESLLETEGIESINEYEMNIFFEEYQLKHYYQSAVEPIHGVIKNIFVTIENDQQKLTRSSLAIARKFDNSILEEKGKGLRIAEEPLPSIIESVAIEESSNAFEVE